MFYQLLNPIDHYLNGRWMLQGLQEWLLSNLQEILDSGNRVVIDIANQIDADLIQLSEGLIDEVEIRRRLENYARRLETLYLDLSKAKFPVTAHTTSAAETLRGRLEILGPVEDLHLSHVFA